MTINEVSKKLNISQDTLRFYEKIGLLGTIKRDKSGYRNYEEPDLKRIEFIMCMRSAELSIEFLKRYISLYEKGEDTREERKKILIEQKELLGGKIKSMQKAYERLEYKINLYYEGKLDEYLEKMNKEWLI